MADWSDVPGAVSMQPGKQTKAVNDWSDVPGAKPVASDWSDVPGATAAAPGPMGMIDFLGEQLKEGNYEIPTMPAGAARALAMTGLPQELMKDAISANPFYAFPRQGRALSGEKLGADEAEQLRRAQSLVLAVPAAMVGAALGGPVGAEVGAGLAEDATGMIAARAVGSAVGKRVAGSALGFMAQQAASTPNVPGSWQFGSPEMKKEMLQTGAAGVLGAGFGTAELVAASRMRMLKLKGGSFWGAARDYLSGNPPSGVPQITPRLSEIAAAERAKKEALQAAGVPEIPAAGQVPEPTVELRRYGEEEPVRVTKFQAEQEAKGRGAAEHQPATEAEAKFLPARIYRALAREQANKLTGEGASGEPVFAIKMADGEIYADARAKNVDDLARLAQFKPERIRETGVIVNGQFQTGNAGLEGSLGASGTSASLETGGRVPEPGTPPLSTSTTENVAGPQALPSQASAQTPSPSAITLPGTPATQRTGNLTLRLPADILPPSQRILHEDSDAERLTQTAHILLKDVVDRVKNGAPNLRIPGFGDALATWRAKDATSVARKLAGGRPAESISDYMGLRIVTNTPDEDVIKLGKLFDDVQHEDVNHNGYQARHVQVKMRGMPMSAEIQLLTPGHAVIQQIAHPYYNILRNMKPNDGPEAERLYNAAMSGLSKVQSMAPDVSINKAVRWLRAMKANNVPEQIQHIADVGTDVADKVYRGEMAPIALPQPKYMDPVFARITQAIRDVVPRIGETSRLRAQELQQRARLGEEAYAKAGGGQAGYMALRQAQKGEMPVAQFEPAQVSPQDVEYAVRSAMDPMNRMGVYDRANAVDGLYKMLGVGQYSEGGVMPQASQIRLMRKVYGNPMVEAMLEHQTDLQKWGTIFQDFIQVPRELMSGPDLSAAGRQAIGMVVRPEFWGALSPMVKAFGSQQVYEQQMRQIEDRATYPIMRDVVRFTGFDDDVMPGEERYGEGLVAQMPGPIGKIYKASERSFTIMLNRVRADVFDSVYANAKAAGYDVSDPQFLKDLGDFVSVGTGRGGLPNAIARGAGLINGFIFSPQLMSARLRTLPMMLGVPAEVAGVPVGGLEDDFVRKEAAKTFLGSAAAIAGVMAALAAIPGVRVGVDPRSADFGKLRYGNTRVDLLSGMQQPVRVISQLIAGQVVSSTTGHPMTVNNPDLFTGDRPEGYSPNRPGLSRLDILWRWVENKEAPLASFIIDGLRGTDPVGKPFSLIPTGEGDLGAVLERTVPLVFQDMYDAYREWSGMKTDVGSIAKGLAGAAAVAPATIIGIGTQTYAPQAPTVTFEGVKLTASADVEREFADQVLDAEKAATLKLTTIPRVMALPQNERDKVIQRVVNEYRLAVEKEWIGANHEAIRQAVLNGENTATLSEPPESLPVALQYQSPTRGQSQYQQLLDLLRRQGSSPAEAASAIP